MLKIERVLCPIDFSEFSATAFDYACSLARYYEAKLFLEHVVSPVGATYPRYMLPDAAVATIYWDLSADAGKRLQEMVKKRASNGFQPELVVHKGLVPETILTFAKEQAVNLIVMGTHGRRGWDRLMTGSVTESVLRKALCPVLAVRKPAHNFVDPKQGDDIIHLRKILFCTDFSENSSAALEYALSLAQEYRAELTVLHVLEEFPGRELQTKTEEVEHKLREPIPPDALDWCSVKTRVRVGKPYQEIIQLALEDQIDLIVLGVRGRSAADLAVFGSTTHRVIQLGPCPVLAVHMEAGQELAD
jgi:nucleotide-binding universal stress UspA family protein